MNWAADAAEAVESSGFTWEIAVALGSLLVGGLAVASTWWQGKRQDDRHQKQLDAEEQRHKEQLKSEERRFRERLDHERREAVKSTAASAYANANRYVGLLRAFAPRGDLPDQPTSEAIINALGDLQLVMAMGWSESVRTSAGELHLAISKASSAAVELVRVIKAKESPVDAGQEFIRLADEADVLTEKYRAAITEDGDD